MSTFVALPLPVRMFCVLLCAWVVGWFINWAIYSLAYFPNVIGVWRPTPSGAAKRHWLDWVPILGWWRLRRETQYFDKGFWVRPFLIEVVFPLAMLWLYKFESEGGTLPTTRIAQQIQIGLHYQFIAHFVLIALMTAATFIDFDEQTIPDWITVTGTLLGLVGCTFFELWFPLWTVNGTGGLTLVEIDASTPSAWPQWLDGSQGLALGLCIAAAWSFALLDRRWITRRGWGKAVQYFVAGVFRTRWWLIVLGLWVVVSIGIAAAWSLPVGRWRFLMSGLLGLACAGGITWAVRLAASWALRVEALGFGDVTLMAMIGTYLGWQPSLLVFFISPLMAVLIFVLLLALTGRSAGAYGPYLCAGAATVIVFWDYFATRWALPLFELPPSIIFGILAVAVAMLGSILWIWRMIKGRVRGLRGQVYDGR